LSLRGKGRGKIHTQQGKGREEKAEEKGRKEKVKKKIFPKSSTL